MYEPLLDEERRDYLAIALNSNRPPLPRQTGIWERLLCSDCESKLSRWETYARGILYGGPEIAIRNSPFGFVVEGVDYRNFKLFEMSVLWRAGIASRPEFGEVVLGPHAERIREQLLDDDAGPPHRYGTWHIVSPPAVELLREGILPPEHVRIAGHIGYRFLIGGVFWLSFVSAHTEEISDRGLFLTEDGCLPFFVEHEHSGAFIRQLAQDLRETGA